MQYQANKPVQMNQSVSLHNRSNPGNFAQSEHTILLDKYRKALLQLSNIVQINRKLKREIDEIIVQKEDLQRQLLEKERVAAAENKSIQPKKAQMDYQIEELHRINADKNRIIDQLRGSVFQLQRDLDALESQKTKEQNTNSEKWLKIETEYQKKIDSLLTSATLKSEQHKQMIKQNSNSDTIIVSLQQKVTNLQHQLYIAQENAHQKNKLYQSEMQRSVEFQKQLNQLLAKDKSVKAVEGRSEDYNSLKEILNEKLEQLTMAHQQLNEQRILSAELEEKLIAQDQQLKEKMSQLEEDNINLRKELSFLNIHKKGQESQWKDQLRRLEEQNVKLLTKVYLLEAERRRRSVFSSQFQEAPVAGYQMFKHSGSNPECLQSITSLRAIIEQLKNTVSRLEKQNQSLHRKYHSSKEKTLNLIGEKKIQQQKWAETAKRYKDKIASFDTLTHKFKVELERSLTEQTSVKTIGQHQLNQSEKIAQYSRRFQMIASELEKLQRELKVQEGIHKKTDEDLAKLKVAEKLNQQYVRQMRELKIRATEAEKKVMKQELTITSLQSNRDFQAELAEKNVILLEKERQLRELIRVHDGELERRKEKYQSEMYSLRKELESLAAENHRLLRQVQSSKSVNNELELTQRKLASLEKLTQEKFPGQPTQAWPQECKLITAQLNSQLQRQIHENAKLQLLQKNIEIQKYLAQITRLRQITRVNAQTNQTQQAELEQLRQQLTTKNSHIQLLNARTKILSSTNDGNNFESIQQLQRDMGRYKQKIIDLTSQNNRLKSQNELLRQHNIQQEAIISEQSLKSNEEMFKGNQQVHRLNAELLQLREDYLRVNRTLNALRVPQQENSNQLHMPDSALVSELETKTRDCEYYRSQLQKIAEERQQEKQKFQVDWQRLVEQVDNCKNIIAELERRNSNEEISSQMQFLAAQNNTLQSRIVKLGQELVALEKANQLLKESSQQEVMRRLQESNAQFRDILADNQKLREGKSLCEQRIRSLQQELHAQHVKQILFEKQAMVSSFITIGIQQMQTRNQLAKDMSLLETINIHISSNESYQRRNEECLAILVVTFVEIEQLRLQLAMKEFELVENEKKVAEMLRISKVKQSISIDGDVNMSLINQLRCQHHTYVQALSQEVNSSLKRDSSVKRNSPQEHHEDDRYRLEGRLSR